MHDDELRIDTRLVRRLVDASFPKYASLDIAPLTSSGSSNALFRLGDELLVRLPRQPGGSVSIEKEARWLPLVAAGLSTSVPVVVAVGEAGFGYPESWALTTWLDGRTPPIGLPSSGLALDLARLVTELHEITVPAPALSDPALRWYRGGPLADVDEDFRELVDQCRLLPELDLDLDLALAVWDQALTVERQGERTRGWYHGDLLAENLLIRDGRLAAVLDFGGLGVGDGTVDLVVAWEVLDADGRETFWNALEVDDGERLRSMGWALLIALMTFPYYGRTMPARCAARRSMAAAVLAEAART